MPAPRHIFVTGHSGAGKTTYAKRLAEEEGLPLRGLDADPEFARLVGSRKGFREGHIDTSPGFIRELDAARAASVRAAAAERQPHVFEGSQALVDPKLTEGHRRILIDQPESRVIAQRVRREFVKTHKEPRPREAAERAAKGLIELSRPEVAAFRKAPGVEVVRPEKESDKMVAGYHRGGKYVKPREYIRDRIREGGVEKGSQGDWAETGPTPKEHMPPIRFKFKKLSDYDGPELGDPTKLMPYLRSIHKLGQAMFQGIPVEVERPKGTVRKGTNRFGVSWTKKTHHDYGSVPGTRGMDGEEVDVYLGPSKKAPKAYVVHQKSPDGKWYDEDKVMLGFKSQGQARSAFLRNAGPIGKTIVGPITAMPVGQLQKKLERGDRLISPGAIKALRKDLEKRSYKLQGHTNVQGLKVSIENRKGSVRKGTDSDGHEWRTKMKHPYGYLTGTKGADDEPVDAYVGPDKDAPAAFVVHQHKDDGTGYDEDKVMLGFKSKKEAKEAFLKHYDSPKFLGPVSRVSVDRLKELVASKKKLVKISQVGGVAPGPVAEPRPEPQIAVSRPQPGQEAKKRQEAWRLARKAGPGVGGLVGAGVGALLGARRGKLLRHMVAGLGTGATLGWMPDMYSSAREGIRGYRRAVPS